MRAWVFDILLQRHVKNRMCDLVVVANLHNVGGLCGTNLLERKEKNGTEKKKSTPSGVCTQKQPKL